MKVHVTGARMMADAIDKEISRKVEETVLRALGRELKRAVSPQKRKGRKRAKAV